MISNKNYVVVSTIKNELDNFENQLVDLENQTIQPECWVVYVDDTNLRLYQNISNKHRIKVYLIKKKPDMERLYYRRLAINMNHAFNSVKKLGLEASYYLKLDGDIRILEKDYIEKLFGFLENNPEYASVSGAIKTIGERDPKRYNDYPLGAAMLFSQELIEYWNGYPIYPASDTVLNVTAEVLWKKCKLYEKAYFIQNRPTSSRVSVSPTVSTA